MGVALRLSKGVVYGCCPPARQSEDPWHQPSKYLPGKNIATGYKELFFTSQHYTNPPFASCARPGSYCSQECDLERQLSQISAVVQCGVYIYNSVHYVFEL